MGIREELMAKRREMEARKAQIEREVSQVGTSTPSQPETTPEEQERIREQAVEEFQKVNEAEAKTQQAEEIAELQEKSVTVTTTVPISSQTYATMPGRTLTKMTSQERLFEVWKEQQKAKGLIVIDYQGKTYAVTPAQRTMLIDYEYSKKKANEIVSAVSRGDVGKGIDLFAYALRSPTNWMMISTFADILIHNKPGSPEAREKLRRDVADLIFQERTAQRSGGKMEVFLRTLNTPPFEFATTYAIGGGIRAGTSWLGGLASRGSRVARTVLTGARVGGVIGTGAYIGTTAGQLQKRYQERGIPGVAERAVHVGAQVGGLVAGAKTVPAKKWAEAGARARVFDVKQYTLDPKKPFMTARAGLRLGKRDIFVGRERVYDPRGYFEPKTAKTILRPTVGRPVPLIEQRAYAPSTRVYPRPMVRIRPGKPIIWEPPMPILPVLESGGVVGLYEPVMFRPRTRIFTMRDLQRKGVLVEPKEKGIITKGQRQKTILLQKKIVKQDKITDKAYEQVKIAEQKAQQLKKTLEEKLKTRKVSQDQKTKLEQDIRFQRAVVADFRREYERERRRLYDVKREFREYREQVSESVYEQVPEQEQKFVPVFEPVKETKKARDFYSPTFYAQRYTYKPPIPRKFYIPPLSKEAPRKKPRVISYHTYVDGERVTSRPTSKSHALGIGADITDKTRATKFKIKQVFEPGAPLSTYSGTWGTIGHKFDKQGDMYYEKRKYQKDYDVERRKYVKKPQKRAVGTKKMFFSILSSGGKK